jgi:hypothetical protein
MTPAEQMRVWQDWGEAERRAAALHPSVSGFDATVAHPNTTEGATGYPNFDILGNGGEGVTGITTNHDYVSALAQGADHEDAFEFAYGRNMQEWLEEARRTSTNATIVDTQLAIYQKKSEEQARANPEYYKWQAPQTLAVNATTTESAAT